MRIGRDLDTHVSRRQALRLLGFSGVAALVAACTPATPAAAPAPTTAPALQPTPAQPAAQAPAQPAGGAATAQAWDDVVAAAKQEGVISIATYSGTGYRKIMDDFEAAYPGVKVEHTGFQSSSRDFAPRILQERQSGLYLWDLAMMPSPEMMIQIKPVGGLDPLRPILVHPEVLDDKSWVDGFEGGFQSRDKQYAYAITRARSQALWIDTNQVQDGEIKSYKDLLDPKWKGKLFAGDPRTKGSGYNLVTALRLKTHDDTLVKQLFKDQEVVLSTDARQLTEFAARGRYPVSLGAVSKPILLDFLVQGVGKNLKFIPTVELDYVWSGASVMHLINKAPHPAGAKLFANWLLTKDGSTSWAKNIQDNSRRSDVPPFDADSVPEKGVDYSIIDGEAVLDEIQRSQDIAKSYLD